MQNPLDSLPARPVPAILEAMRQLRARSQAGHAINLPLVTLHLQSGSSFRGWIIDANPSSFLLRLDDGDPAPTDSDLVYVDADAIDAVIVHDAASLADILAFGKIEIPASPHKAGPASPSLTPAQARDTAQRLAASLSEIVGVPITFQADMADIPHLPELLSLMTATASVLREIAANPVARRQLACVARTVEFKNADEPSVTASDQTLTIAAALIHSRQDHFGRQQLRREIEKWIR